MAAPNPGIMQRFEDYRPTKSALCWAGGLCAIATIIIGFNWGGWVTGGTARDMTQKAADGATAGLAATLCVAQFKADPASAVQLASLNKADRWDRAGFITKGGWATLPGMKEPVAGAADLCAQQLTAESPPLASAVESSR